MLSVLETGTLMRVGSDREHIEADVRVIAATNRIPGEAVAQGKLREDLLYRLQVFPVQLPPLRERTEDIDLLAQHFLEQMNRQEQADKTFSAEALEQLRSYRWPGNVRELKNAIHRAFIMAEGKVIDNRCLPEGLAMQPPENGPYINMRVGSKLADVERKMILATLDQCGGIRERTAETLGISLKTLYNRLREYRSN
jgi:two-component system response regulator AtoC